jgi:hypothetical protein
MIHQQSTRRELEKKRHGHERGRRSGGLKRIERNVGTCDAAFVLSRGAYLLRENTGTTGVELTARTAVEVLAYWDIPHLIAGGLAVQEHGYERVTTDVDIIVPDVLDAVEMLTADIVGPFKRLAADRLEDQRNGVKIDLLPAGYVLKTGCKVPFPQPREVSAFPQVVTIEQLISLKLDSFAGSPVKRARDKGDVVELIQRAQLPRDLAVAPPVRTIYLEIWDGLKADDSPPVHPT